MSQKKNYFCSKKKSFFCHKNVFFSTECDFSMNVGYQDLSALFHTKNRKIHSDEHSKNLERTKHKMGEENYYQALRKNQVSRNRISIYQIYQDSINLRTAS